ncbi:MAG: NUDIX hydrolase [Candidatus Margulisbacteria bacterium]|nr:NUDIX hydrolase [Candidatus Margulisiibacteriota bacterium]
MSSNDPLHEKLLKKELVYQGSYLNLYRYHIVLPNGKKAAREIVEVRNAVAVLPVDNEGNVYLVRQHRPAIGKTILEIPAGLVDKGETLNHAAKRECEEETGYRPGKLKKLITYAHVEGYSTGFITLFLGTDLVFTNKIHLDSNEFVETKKLSFRELLKLIKSNKIIDSKTTLAAFLSQNILGITP